MTPLTPLTPLTDQPVRSPLGPRPRVTREIVSFVRRSARLSDSQRKAWDDHADRWVVDVPRGDTDTSIDPTFVVDLDDLFGRPAPLIVEIGSGMGGSLVPMARDRPDRNVLAFEVYQPAVARTLAKLARERVDNVRLVQADAVEGLTTMIGPGAIDELWLFFPDPWHKSRHHKRRLLTPAFVDLVASRMRPGARWRLATDWADYALQMRQVLDEHPAFAGENPWQGWSPRWDARPVTRFEERGLEAGRTIVDLTYRRR
ncbi:MAG TPA: tRNA (guanosine(46)-N7)-methyltransferase TrmB [Propionibacteriaceae bacterium]